jgi:hypothetical protein
MTVTFGRGENPLRADKLNAAFGERVLRIGDTMQGPLTLARNPTGAFEAATKQYVDNHVSVSILPIATTTVLGGVKVDGSSIVASADGVLTATGVASGSGIPEAPTDGLTYGRSMMGWNQVIAANNDTIDGGNF